MRVIGDWHRIEDPAGESHHRDRIWLAKRAPIRADTMLFCAPTHQGHPYSFTGSKVIGCLRIATRTRTDGGASLPVRKPFSNTFKFAKDSQTKFPDQLAKSCPTIDASFQPTVQRIPNNGQFKVSPRAIRHPTPIGERDQSNPPRHHSFKNLPNQTLRRASRSKPVQFRRSLSPRPFSLRLSTAPRSFPT